MKHKYFLVGLLSLLTLSSCSFNRPEIKDGQTNNDEALDKDDTNINGNDETENDNQDNNIDKFSSKDMVDYKDIISRFSNSNDKLLEFENDKINLLQYSFFKFSTSKNSLFLTYGEKDSGNGLSVQNVTKLKKNNKGFIQDTSIINNPNFLASNYANKIYYDESFNKITYYSKSSLNEYKNIKLEDGISLTEDEYIARFGKLDFNQYVLDKELKFTSYTNNEAKLAVDTTSLFTLIEDTVYDLEFISNEDLTYTFKMKVKVDGLHNFSSYIKEREELAKNPSNFKVSLEFKLDNNFNLIDSNYIAEYSIVLYGVNVIVKESAYTKYFTSVNSLSIENKEINIPTLNEEFNLKLNKDGEISF